MMHALKLGVWLQQVPIFELLRKFDGVRIHDDIKAGRRRYRLTRLPAYLVLHMKRFTKNNFFWEKNPTIVNFPVRNLELRDTIPVPSGEFAPVSCLWLVILPWILTMFLCAVKRLG